MIYDMERILENEKSLLDKARPVKARDAIKEFLDDWVTLRNLSTHRYYYYSVRLRKSLEILNDKFLDPGENDLKEYLKALMAKVSDRTVVDYVDSYVRFIKWLNKGKLPDRFSVLAQFKPKKNGKSPEDLITPDEFQKMIDNSISARNKGLISVLYDSGCRIGEVLGLKRKDVVFDQYGMQLSVNGKTGYRKVYVVGSSTMFMKLWLKENASTDLDSYVFIEKTGKGMTYADARKMLLQTLRRAGITKRIHPHLFRHTRASILASEITEVLLESQMGWIHGSRQSQTYVHLSGEAQRKAVLKAYGLISENEQLETGLRTCPNCGNQISVKAEYCPFCYTDFTGEKIRA